MTQNFDPTSFPLNLFPASLAIGVVDGDMLNLLVNAINQLAAQGGASMRTLPNGGTRTLLSTDGFILTGTAGSGQVLKPPALPAAGQLITIVDAVGEISGPSDVISWQGTISGDVNPTLIDVAYASAQVYYTGSKWLRIR